MHMCGIIALINSANDPGRSGMLTLMRAFFFSPKAARSATNRRRSKLMFAPEAIATRFREVLDEGWEATIF